MLLPSLALFEGSPYSYNQMRGLISVHDLTSYMKVSCLPLMTTDIRRSSPVHSISSHWKENRQQPILKAIRAHGVRRPGHLVRYCPLPDLRSCFKCGAQGHIAPRCPVTKDAPINSSNTVKNIQLVQNYSDIYMKSVKVDGTYVKAYLDTGSQVNVMSTEVARLLSLPIKPTQIILKGFSGGMLTTRGEVTFKLEVDKLNIPCQAYLTDINMNNIHLLIGQPIINHEGVTLLVHNNTAVLQQDCDFLSQIEVTEERQKFNVVTHSKETLPPGSSIIMVDIEGNNQDADVITPVRHFEMDGISYSIPATILRGCQGHLKVFNSGTKDILWEPGVVLVRAEICKHTPLRHQVSHNDVTTSLAHNSVLCISPSHSHSHSHNHDTSIGGVNLNDIDVGALSEQELDCLINLLIKHKTCFACNTNELGCTDLVQMKISL
ncbi:hypothetical protein JYU34_009065, partial [Plutella xylostella]